MGGSGDGGYSAQQAGIEQKKQQARDSLNALFGVGPKQTGSAPVVAGAAPSVVPFGSALPASSGNPLQAPDRTKFMRPATTTTVMPDIGEWGGNALASTQGESFDQAGYDNALAGYNAATQQQSSADSNANARDSLYQQVRDGAYTAGKRKLDENLTDARRKNKFELFARGLAGGSEDIDQNTREQRVYNQGVLDLGAQSDAAKAKFRNSDEDTRLQLLQSIDNGMDQGSALASATNRMAIAADQASADAQGTSLGNLFDTSGLLYTKSQASQGKQAALDWWNQYQAANRQGGSPTGVSTTLPGER
jgi:hypothetical protein